MAYLLSILTADCLCHPIQICRYRNHIVVHLLLWTLDEWFSSLFSSNQLTNWVASYTLTLMFVLVHFVTPGLFTTSSLPPQNVKFIFPLCFYDKWSTVDNLNGTRDDSLSDWVAMVMWSEALLPPVVQNERHHWRRLGGGRRDRLLAPNCGTNLVALMTLL